MKFISWNVNGLRACIQKGFLEEFDRMDADFFCLQETKLQEGQIQLDLPGYQQYWNYAQKKGYSGTAIFTKHTPLSVQYGIGIEEFDTEGRVITLEYQEFFLVTCYTPNAQRGLARLDYRMDWDEVFRGYISTLDAQKPVILCGDLNVAHQEIDLKNPKSNRGSAGFSDEERASFTKTLSLGFTDTFRHLNPDATDIYSWWSYMYHARENNAGWRIDYFLTSDRVRDQIIKTPIYTDIMGSDHCPVGLELDTLCNGSLWSPNAPGKARDLTPTKEKKPSPGGKAVLTFALLFLLLLGGILVGYRLFPGETEPTEDDTLSASESSESPTETGPIFTIEPAPAPLFDAEVLSSLPKMTTITELSDQWAMFQVEDRIYTLQSGRPDYSEINFCVLLKLNEAGRKEYTPNKIPTVMSAQGNTEYFLQPYYDPLALSEIPVGWMLCGYTTRQEDLIVVFGFRRDVITVAPLPQAPHFELLIETNPVNYVWDINDMFPRWSYYSNNGTTYKLGKLYGQSTFSNNINFAILVLPNASGLLEAGQDYCPKVNIPILDTDFQTEEFFFMIQFCDDPRTDLPMDGWLIYGHTPDSVMLSITYCDQMELASVDPVFDTLDINIYNVTSPIIDYAGNENGTHVMLDGIIYRLGDDIQEGNRPNSNYWITLEPTKYALNHFDASLTPTAGILTPPGSKDEYIIGICPYYHVISGGVDIAETEPIGWIVYLYLDHQESVYLRYGITYSLSLDPVNGNDSIFQYRL